MTESRYSVLVIEDNDADVFLIKRAIIDSGIPAELTVLSDGESVLNLLDSPRPEDVPDAIILDLCLPRVDGVHLLSKFRSHPSFAGIPVMIFTSSPSLSDRRRAEMLAVRYVQKPINLDSFVREVESNVKAMLCTDANGVSAS